MQDPSEEWRFNDFSPQSQGRVVLLTAVGTVCCIAFALAFDSYSFEEGFWRWGARPENNVIIPLLIAPPFFFYLLSKLRQLAIAHERLMVVASTDSLTSCLNRVAFTTLVDAYLERIDRLDRSEQGALLVVDVDYFKTVNDSFGHDVGDDALKLIVTRMKSALREVDLIGRMGGEEFCIFLPGIGPDKAQIVAERVRETVRSAVFCPEGKFCNLTISVGGAVFVQATTFSELYKTADRRLYDAKRKGRDRVELSQLRADSQQMAIH